MRIIKTLYPSVTIKRNPPANLSAGDEKFFGGPDFTYTIRASHLLYYRNVAVTHHGIIMKNFLPEKDLIVSYNRDFKKYRWRYILHAILKMKKQVLPEDEKYILLFDNYSGPKGLAHWYSDSLTRIIEIKDLLKDHTALVPWYFKRNEFIYDSLQLLGMKKFRVIEENTRVMVKDLYVASHIAESGNFNPVNTDKLRAFFLERNEDKLQFSLGERIYISRSRAAFRKVLNEKEVTELLSAYGFKVVYMEDYNLSQKISMAYNATHMAGVIGAAFSFIHFMRPGSSILEFRNTDSFNSIYYSLSDANGLKYYYQICDTVMHDFESQNFDVTVNLELLKKNIELILSH